MFKVNSGSHLQPLAWILGGQHLLRSDNQGGKMALNPLVLLNGLCAAQAS